MKKRIKVFVKLQSLSQVVNFLVGSGNKTMHQQGTTRHAFGRFGGRDDNEEFIMVDQLKMNETSFHVIRSLLWRKALRIFN